MADFLVRSVGRGVFLLTVEGDALRARSVGLQLGDVIESWTDPDSEGTLHAVVVKSARPASKYEERVADEEVTASVVRAAESSSDDSELRFRLGLVDDDCERLLGKDYVKKFDHL